MSHAGIPAQWSIEQALALSNEVQSAMMGDQAKAFFQKIYGNQSNHWHSSLTGMDRLRTIVNYLTRMRFVGPNGELDLLSKEGVGTAPDGFLPWFKVQPRTSNDQIGRASCRERE